MTEFFVLKTADEARALLARFAPLAAEVVALGDADGRVAAAAIVSPEALPAFARATRDGYAVRARDTAGASEGVPAFLRVVGQVPTGGVLGLAVGAGEAAAIATGGALPDGADAAVMVEYTDERDGEVEVRRPAGAGENVIWPGDDLAAGAPLVAPGRVLGPADVAVLAAAGVDAVAVVRRPRVAVLSTGDEIVSAGARPAPGQVRDANGPALAAAARRAGCLVEAGGVVGDDRAALTAACRALLERCDALLLSGGSSVGTRDLTAAVLADLGGKTLFHGLTVRPGKPTLAARVAGKPVLGLPGVPVSALVIFHVFVRPLLLRLGGRREGPGRRARARLARRTPSPPGREDYVRVRLEERGGVRWAEPLLGGSAALATVLGSDGLLVIPAGVEGVEEGEEVEILMEEGS